MRGKRSREPSGSIPLIGRTPVNPLDPIAYWAAVARSEGQGRRPVFRVTDTRSNAVSPENVGRRRSLALGRSEHDGRLMTVQGGGARAAVPKLRAMLAACTIIVFTVSGASAEPPSGESLVRPAMVAVSSDPWSAHIAEAAHRFAIPERWIRVIMAVESLSDPAALSPKGAIGLMQIMPATWEELRTRYGLGDDPWQPRDNILAGAAYLREMHDHYGSVDAMLAAYNAGPARYDEHLASGRTLPAETLDYVVKITPMIDGAVAIARTVGRPSRLSWSRAPLFVARSFVADQDIPATADLPSGGPLDARAIVDLSALVPPSDGLFVRRPAGEGERR